ncbi:hypothetical protein MTO96_045511 [Rhipicephalus appendiculatus]
MECSLSVLRKPFEKQGGLAGNSYIMENLKSGKTLRLVVLDEEEFWVALKSCHTLLEPIAMAIKAAESDGALLSDVINLFHNLAEEIHSNLQCSVLSQSERDLAEKALKTREEFSVHPVHCAANLLDPRYKGENLTDEEILLAFDWISEPSTHMNLEVGKVYSDVGGIQDQCRHMVKVRNMGFC